MTKASTFPVPIDSPEGVKRWGLQIVATTNGCSKPERQGKKGGPCRVFVIIDGEKHDLEFAHDGHNSTKFQPFQLEDGSTVFLRLERTEFRAAEQGQEAQRCAIVHYREGQLAPQKKKAALKSSSWRYDDNDENLQ